MQSALVQLEHLQNKNSASRITPWREKCYPDSHQQRCLIAKGMSVRFMKGEVIAELQELRDEGGNAAHAHTHIKFDIPERPSTAPASSNSGAFPDIKGANGQQEEEEEDPHAHMGRTRKSFTLLGQKSENNAYLDSLKKTLQRRPKSAHAQRQQFLDILTAPASAVEKKVMTRNIEQQCKIESRDPMTVFQYLRDKVAGAKAFKFRSDTYGTKQELDLRRVIKKADSTDSKKLGMAIVFDPSIVTEGYDVILRFKYIYDKRRIHGHTTSNVGNGNRQTNAAANFAASKGLAAPYSSVGRLQRSASMPSMEAAVARNFRSTSFRDTPTSSKSSHNLLNLAKQGEKKEKKKFGAAAPKEKKDSVEVDYQLNTSRKCHYDLQLTTNPKARSSPIVNSMPMFLPGWEGCLPLFIPSGFALCQVLVCPEGEERSWPASPASPWTPTPHSSRPSTAQNSRPGSAMRAGMTSGELTGTAQGAFKDISDDFLKHPAQTISLTGFAFPAESVYRALHTLKKLMEGDVKKQLSNLMVPGGEPALHVAALHGNNEACRRILQNGANVNLANKPALLTALHEAVIGGSRECVEVLLEFGANEAQQDCSGNSALHLASESGNIPAANLLMKSKESARVLLLHNKAGRTPLDVVKSSTMRQTIERGMRMHHLVVPVGRKTLG